MNWIKPPAPFDVVAVMQFNDEETGEPKENFVCGAYSREDAEQSARARVSFNPAVIKRVEVRRHPSGTVEAVMWDAKWMSFADSHS
jgi:hypothetical protein